MEFQTALTNVIITLLYILPGYISAKCRIVKPEHLSSMSSVLVYVCAPCMIVHAFLNTDFSGENIGNMGLFFVITFALQVLFMLVIYALFKKKYYDAKYRILTIASVMGNVGFFGLPIIRALMPDNPEVSCYSSVYIISMNILVFTVGVYCLTREKKYMSLRAAVLNPSVIALLVALPLHFFSVGQYVPDVLMNAVNLLSSMTTPLCMIILGVRLSTVRFLSLFSKPFVYIICLGKLVVFPLFCYLTVAFLPLPFSFKASVLILSAVPCASVILNMAEIHHAETELAANCVLISTLLCFITIPLLTLVL